MRAGARWPGGSLHVRQAPCAGRDSPKCAVPRRLPDAARRGHSADGAPAAPLEPCPGRLLKKPEGKQVRPAAQCPPFPVPKPLRDLKILVKSNCSSVTCLRRTENNLIKYRHMVLKRHTV